MQNPPVLPTKHSSVVFHRRRMAVVRLRRWPSLSLLLLGLYCPIARHVVKIGRPQRTLALPLRCMRECASCDGPQPSCWPRVCHFVQRRTATLRMLSAKVETSAPRTAAPGKLKLEGPRTSYLALPLMSSEVLTEEFEVILQHHAYFFSYKTVHSDRTLLEQVLESIYPTELSSS